MQIDTPFDSKLFVPKNLRDYPLYSHLVEIVDFILNENVVQFKSVEELNEIVATFFGTSIDEIQKESILIYYKIFVEPFLGTPQAIERLFNILNLEATVVTWFNNKVPLPPYKFNIEFADAPENLDVQTLLDLINMVKNERSHLAAIKDPNAPDAAVWDWSLWDRDAWDNPSGIDIGGIIWNLIKKFFLYYELGITLPFYKNISRKTWIFEMFLKNGVLNKDLIANGLDTFKGFSFNIVSITPFGLKVMYDTQLIGEIDDTLLVSSLPYNRSSVAREIENKYEDGIISHLNTYSQFRKNSLKQIIGIRNKTQNKFYYESVGDDYLTLDNNDILKDYTPLILDSSLISSPDISTLFINDFNIFCVFKLEGISTAYKTFLKTFNNSLKLEFSNSKVRISSLTSNKEYIVSNVSNRWCYFSLSSNSLNLNGNIYPHNLSLKIDSNLVLGDSTFSRIKISNLLINDNILSALQLNRYLSLFFN